MKLDKKLADEVIRLTKEFYRTNDRDYLNALLKAREVLGESSSWPTVGLVEDLSKYIQTSGKGTYDDIYKALAVFGIIVEDNMNDMLVVGKTKTFNIAKNDTDYYIQLSNNTEILVTKEEFYSNIIGTELRLESKVEYK